MKPRLNASAAAPDAMQAMLALEDHDRGSGLEPTLIERVKTRASQVNGCAYCIEMHTREAPAAGETEARLYLLSAWRESPLYTDRERAALAWTEALTLVAQTHGPDADYEEALKHLGPQETEGSAGSWRRRRDPVSRRNRSANLGEE